MRLGRIERIVVALTLLASVAAPAAGQNLADVVDRVRPSVAFVFVQGPHICAPGCAGSAFAVGIDGLFITALHVLADGTSISVRSPGGISHQADVLAVDVPNDIAILRVYLPILDAGNQTGLVPLTLAPPGTIRAGQDVVVLGYPLADSPLLPPSDVTVTKGIISAIRPPLVQVDAAMNPGNSGGPVLDTTGKVVGMADQGYRGTGLNFAVSADAIAAFLGRVLSQPRVAVNQPPYEYCPACPTPPPPQSQTPATSRFKIQDIRAVPLPLVVTRTATLSFAGDRDRHMTFSHSGQLLDPQSGQGDCVSFPSEALAFVGFRGQLHKDGPLPYGMGFWLTSDGQTVSGSGLLNIVTVVGDVAGSPKNASVPGSICLYWYWTIDMLRITWSSFEVTYWLDYEVWSQAIMP